MHFFIPECYLLDLGLIKLLCKQNSADILYSEDGGSSRQYFVKGFVEELKASLAQNAKYAIIDDEQEPTPFELQGPSHLLLWWQIYVKTGALMELFLEGITPLRICYINPTK